MILDLHSDPHLLATSKAFRWGQIPLDPLVSTVPTQELVDVEVPHDTSYLGSVDVANARVDDVLALRAAVMTEIELRHGQIETTAVGTERPSF